MPAGNRGFNRFSAPPQPGAFPWSTRINQADTLANRPPASWVNRGLYFLATDVNGGTFYRSDGANWVQATTGVTGGGTVTSVSGTTNQVAVATGTTTPVVSLSGPHNFTTLTANAVLVGNGTSPPQTVAIGTAGRLLLDQGAGVPPSFSSLSGVGFTATLAASGALTITGFPNSSLANSSVTVTAGAGLTGGGAVSLGGSVSLAVDTGTSGHKIPYLDGNNTFSGNNTFTGASEFDKDVLVKVSETPNNGVAYPLVLQHYSTSSPSNGIGTGIQFLTESTSLINQLVGTIEFTLPVVNSGTRTAALAITLTDNAATRTVIAAGANGSAATVGFLGATAAVRQTGDVAAALATNGLMDSSGTYTATKITGQIPTGSTNWAGPSLGANLN